MKEEEKKDELKPEPPKPKEEVKELKPEAGTTTASTSTVKVELKPEEKKPEPKKKLVSLQDFNTSKTQEYADAAVSKRNGIECPKCGEELQDVNPLDVFGTNPPTMEISCTRCDYRGRRIA